MSDIAIKVENLSKLYKIGALRNRHDTLRDRLTDIFTDPFRRLFNPSPSISHLSSSNSHIPSSSPSADTIWALKDVSFEVKNGEVVGIIGGNGAGKSTLLKILSRITEPTEGRAIINGRVGSLLEVGTGFHPELTGRENISLNGAILGMKKQEIDRKFDEIVAFAEIEKFLDTPVKHYSSGMYVRLAFAVAAHLEPEILLVDEVLSVGDAAFQKKCLGKMGDVAKEGRTVLFVSHNMGAVRLLCERAILLEKGEVILDEGVSQIISMYMSIAVSEGSGTDGGIFWAADNALETNEVCLRGIQLVGPSGKVQSMFGADKPIQVAIHYEVKRPLRNARLNLYIITQEGEVAFVATDHMFRSEIESPGTYKSICTIPGGLLNLRRYVIAVDCDIPGVKVLLPRREYLSFMVSGIGNQAAIFPEAWPGVVCPHILWRIEKIQ